MTSETPNDELPFNEEFCTYLEFHLCRTFQKSPRPDIRNIWCDGILWTPTPDNQLAKKSVNDTHVITAKAWLGVSGQEEYKMRIHFGSSALRRYTKSLSLIDCIPSEETMDWITIDTNKKEVDIQLQ